MGTENRNGRKPFSNIVNVGDILQEKLGVTRSYKILLAD